MLITFSGLDGSGKSTQINYLKEWLENNNNHVIYIWARGGYSSGFVILKKYISFFFPKKINDHKNEYRTKIFKNSILSRIWINIAVLDLIFIWVIYIRIKMLQGKTVICDRYIDDTLLDFIHKFPYENFQNFFLWKFLRSFIPKPDLSFLFFVDVEESIRRSKIKKEPFPDDSKTLEWRLSCYMNDDIFSSEKYFKINCIKSKLNIFSDIKNIKLFSTIVTNKGSDAS